MLEIYSESLETTIYKKFSEKCFLFSMPFMEIYSINGEFAHKPSCSGNETIQDQLMLSCLSAASDLRTLL